MYFTLEADSVFSIAEKGNKCLGKSFAKALTFIKKKQNKNYFSHWSLCKSTTTPKSHQKVLRSCRKEICENIGVR